MDFFATTTDAPADGTVKSAENAINIAASMGFSMWEAPAEPSGPDVSDPFVFAMD